MRIIFAGTPANAADVLTEILNEDFEVVGVITRTDAPVGRKKVISPSPVAEIADANQIPVLKANSITSKEIDWIKNLQADLGVVVAYGSILKEEVLSLPIKGWINLHYSLLPQYPGAAPVQHAIKDGARLTGVSIFRLDKGVDTGPILAQEQVPIEGSDNASTLLRKLTRVGSKLIVDTLGNIDERFSNQQAQDPTEERVIASKISRKDARVFFKQPVEKIHNLVRAMNPEPMAWFEYSGEPVRLLSAMVSSEHKLPAGEATLLEGRLFVGTQDFALELIEVQPSGKTAMPASDWFRGLRKPRVELS